MTVCGLSVKLHVVDLLFKSVIRQRCHGIPSNGWGICLPSDSSLARLATGLLEGDSGSVLVVTSVVSTSSESKIFAKARFCGPVAAGASAVALVVASAGSSSIIVDAAVAAAFFSFCSVSLLTEKN